MEKRENVRRDGQKKEAAAAANVDPKLIDHTV
jgi:hypothetical protein